MTKRQLFTSETFSLLSHCQANSLCRSNSETCREDEKQKPNSQPPKDYLSQCEERHQLWDEYYHCCGSW